MIHLRYSRKQPQVATGGRGKRASHLASCDRCLTIRLLPGSDIVSKCYIMGGGLQRSDGIYTNVWLRNTLPVAIINGCEEEHTSADTEYLAVDGRGSFCQCNLEKLGHIAGLAKRRSGYAGQPQLTIASRKFRGMHWHMAPSSQFHQ